MELQPIISSKILYRLKSNYIYWSSNFLKVKSNSNLTPMIEPFSQWDLEKYIGFELVKGIQEVIFNIFKKIEFPSLHVSPLMHALFDYIFLFQRRNQISWKQSFPYLMRSFTLIVQHQLLRVCIIRVKLRRKQIKPNQIFLLFCVFGFLVWFGWKIKNSL